EEVRLLDLLRDGLVLRAAALLVEVLLLLEAFAALAVETLVVLLEQHRLAGLRAARIVEAADQLLHRQLVALVGGADELVVRDTDGLPRALEVAGVLVHERARILAGGGGGLRDLLAVLVGAGEKERRVAALAVEARERVGEDLLVRVTEVRPSVDVIDRGRD